MIAKALRFITFWTALGAFGVLAISATFKPETLPKLQLCTFKQFTGKPCPGCGLTRAFCAISHGRFGEAFYFNPFSFILYSATVVLMLWPLLARWFPALRDWFERTIFFVWAVPATLVAMILYGTYRIFYGPNV